MPLGERGGDAAVAPAFAIGWGLTLLPEQIANLVEGADWAEVRADLLVDSGGFLVGEGAGLGAFLLSGGTGPSSIAFKLGADVLVGAGWDTVAEVADWREALAEMLRGSEPSAATPPAAQGTPAPPPMQSSEEMVPPEPVPIPHPKATSTPEPGTP